MTFSREETPDIRVAIHMRTINDCEPLHVLNSWMETLDPPFSSIRGCIWVSGQNRFQSSHCDLASNFCWHVLTTPDSVDRYVQHFSKEHSWTPWGTKSGPNYQFFEILDRSGTMHPEEWTLLIEDDCRPFGSAPGVELSSTLAAHSKAWMIGGVPHASIAMELPAELRNHLNGAALYRASDAQFRIFLRTAWLPALLESIRQNERYAFDCITSPEVYSTLSPMLRHSWLSQSHRFVVTPGILNLSTTTIDESWTTAIPASEVDGTTEARTGTWLVHAKGFERLGCE